MTRIVSKKLRLKACANPACGSRFEPQRLGQKVCSPACAIAVAPANHDRARKAIAQRERREIRVRKKAIKGRGEYLKEAQAAFNAYIRERDRGLPCISCGRHHQGQYHSGHYRTVGANPELRFEPLNAHKQCAPCNNHKSGDIVNYRINLVAKIGAEAVAWLEGPHEPKKYTIEELQAIKAQYRAMTRELKGRVA